MKMLSALFFILLVFAAMPAVVSAHVINFDEINKELEISCIEKDEFLLREIRRKIIEKIEEILKFLGGILDPETNITDMYEAKIFDSEERNELFKLYQKLMFFDRYSIETSVDEDNFR